VRKPKVTIRQIADLVGVSQSTVSRALAGHPAISEDTRLRIAEAARTLNYGEPKATSRQTATRMIGVVVAALHNQFYVHFLDYLHDELRAHGYHMTLIIDSLLDEEAYLAFEPLVHDFLDGIIITTASVSAPIVSSIKRLNIPTVLAVRSIDGLPFDTVEVDNEIAGQEAARHLFGLGHRRIGFILGPADTSTSRDRFNGAVNFLAERNAMPADDWIHWGAYTHASGYSSLLALITGERQPTAVICGNDTIAIGAMEAARRRGIDVPGQLSIIGFDDIPISGWEMVQLTTVRQPIAEMAALAARRLIEQIRADAPLAPRHDRLPVSLVRRNTTGNAAH
jgi:LacI family transcriptional regulator